MAVLPAAAVAAYRAAAQMGTGTAAASSASASAASGVGSFADFLSNAVHDSVATMKHGEEMAAKNAVGKADIVDVVNAVNAAELTLDTVVAVRDKVISAYQTVMNMSI
jgi:flagellar hook-basal body complex protein FliE